MLDQIRRHYVIEARRLDAETEAALRADPRPGAQSILDAIARRRAENRSEGQRLRKLLQFETPLWAAGVLHVAGVDEAGMSSARRAGRRCCSHIRARSREFLRRRRFEETRCGDREKLAVEIKGRAVAWAVAFAEVEEIDRINIYWAGLLAMRRAVEALFPAPQHILIDARRLKELTTPQQAIVKGDSKSLTIAAASILAKTARDALMCKLDAEHPGYGFSKHKGYPVREHVAALERLGASPIHRRSFAPVRSVLGLPPLPPWPNAAAVSGRAREPAQPDIPGL